MDALHLAILGLGFILIGALPVAFGEPVLHDDSLILEEFAHGVGWGHTTMTFVDDDILILHKAGTVHLIRDGIMQNEPVLKVTIDPTWESGLLGITSADSAVYIYFTAAGEGGHQLGNKIYKYDWDGETLVNPVLAMELPSNIYHDGGAMVTGLDNQVYAVIGDTGKYGPLQNKSLENLYPPGTTDYLDTSVILRVDPDGPYQAVGIRNSFGLAIDPVTGNLWDTENGDDDFDEINLVPDRFNSGWNKIMGPATQSELDSLVVYEDYVYKDPEFSWKQVVAPTGLSFGKFKETSTYDDSLFVGDCNYGNLYKFTLNQNRDGFEFINPDLQDNLVDNGDSMDEIILGTGFKCITDIERGPDGFLYIVSHGEKEIYRIVPAEALGEEYVSDSPPEQVSDINLVLVALLGASTAVAIFIVMKQKKK